MRCNACGKWYERGTDTLPNYCDKCLKYIQIIVIEPTVEEKINQLLSSKKMFEEDIKKHEAEILKDQDLIEYFEQEIALLKNTIK